MDIITRYSIMTLILTSYCGIVVTAVEMLNGVNVIHATTDINAHTPYVLTSTVTKSSTQNGVLNASTKPPVTWADIRKVCDYETYECNNKENKQLPGYQYACVPYVFYSGNSTLICSRCLSDPPRYHERRCTSVCNQPRSGTGTNLTFMAVCSAPDTTTATTTTANPLPETPSLTPSLTPSQTPSATECTPAAGGAATGEVKNEWPGLDLTSTCIGVVIGVAIVLIIGGTIFAVWKCIVIGRLPQNPSNNRSRNAELASSNATEMQLLVGQQPGDISATQNGNSVIEMPDVSPDESFTSMTDSGVVCLTV